MLPETGCQMFDEWSEFDALSIDGFDKKLSSQRFGCQTPQWMLSVLYGGNADLPLESRCFG